MKNRLPDWTMDEGSRGVRGRGRCGGNRNSGGGDTRSLSLFSATGRPKLSARPFPDLSHVIYLSVIEAGEARLSMTLGVGRKQRRI